MALYLPPFPASLLQVTELLQRLLDPKRRPETALAPTAMARTRDAEAELNLPPGFRFHPTDEELVADYLVRRATGRRLPVPIIAEVDLYKFNPWDLPEMALFGKREWYFFTPRDRKYQNGSRPNRTARSGYWKATGADKPVSPPGAGRPLGIKKALVFYSGKAPKGVKTDWIMHEYRLADVDRSAVNKKGSLRLDDCVLCRLYNKKNKWEKQQPKKQVASVAQSSPATASFKSNNGSTWSADSLWTTDSDVEHDAFGEITGDTNWREVNPAPLSQELQMVEAVKEESQWFLDIDLEDFQSTLAAIVSGQKTDESNQNYYDSGDWKQNQHTCLQSFWN